MDTTKSVTEPLPMAGFPPPPEARISPQNWAEPRFLRWSLMNRSAQVPSVTIWRGDGPVSALPDEAQDLDLLPVPGPNGQQDALRAVIEALDMDAFIVLHRGRIVYERYLHAMQPHTQHGTASVSKAFMAVLAAILQEQGVLDLTREAQHYVPGMRGTSMGDATLQQLLDMQAGIVRPVIPGRTDLIGQQDGGVYEILGLLPLQPDVPADFYDFVLRKPRSGPHGVRFYYDNGQVEALAWAVRRATGRSIADLQSELIFAPMGMQRDGSMTVDRLGTEFSSGGLSITLRDMARFGEMVRNAGWWNGRQIVPEAFLAETWRGVDRAMFADTPLHAVMPAGSYHNSFHVLHDDLEGLVAVGRHGQRIYVSPRAEVVIAQFSSAAGPPPHPFERPTVLLHHHLATHFMAG